jgi:hypothetical protein
MLAAIAVLFGVTQCAGRVIYYPVGCADRLGSPYKQAECMACVARPLPHAYYADEPDGNRCHPTNAR